MVTDGAALLISATHFTKNRDRTGAIVLRQTFLLMS